MENILLHCIGKLDQWNFGGYDPHTPPLNLNLTPRFLESTSNQRGGSKWVVAQKFLDIVKVICMIGSDIR